MFVSVALLIVLAQAGPARDPRPVQPRGTAVIAGRVLTSDQAPQPVRRAQVVVTKSEGNVERTVVTDDDGRFSVDGLPAGRYNVTATKAGWLRASYGAVRPGRPGTAFPMAVGQRKIDLALTMAKGGVITGSVIDSTGKPAPGVLVKLMQFRYENGRRVLSAATAAAGSSAEKTDDRGEYRLFGLMPGEYVVSATPDDPGGGTTRASGGGTVGYVPVYYPATTVAADATAVTVAAGEEVAGIDLGLRYVKTARVAGTIVAPDGFPTGDLRVTLIPDSTTGVTGGSSTANVAASLRMLAVVGQDRAFAFNGITPGRYTVMAQGIERITPPPGDRPSGLNSQRMALWASVDLAVDGADISGVTLTMRPGLTVSGRVQFDATANGLTPPADLSKVKVYLYNTTRTVMSVAGSFPSASVNAAGEFTIKAVMPGRYRVSASYANDLANGWSSSNALLNGQDTLDTLLDVPAEEPVNGLTITMTRATQTVTGVLQDATGRPRPGLTVILFPSDRALWSVTRRLRSARSGQDGRYTISNIPSGDYRLAAVPDFDPVTSSNAAFLEQLLPTSIPIVVKSGERKVQDVRIAAR
jgi:5-hydroxyisourate hydrolase-like protein (transthyretin family)